MKIGSNVWELPSKTDSNDESGDVSLFSSSLPVFPREKLKYTDSDHGVLSVDDTSSEMDKLKDALEDLDIPEIGSLLPDDEEELLAGIMDDFDLSELPSQLEELEDYDIFGSGGGMELDSDTIGSLSMNMARTSINDGFITNGINQHALSNGSPTVAGEHPYGEHPSRTLFVRNINSNVEDSELQALFEQYGDIRTLYTACKHRGFVMISYFDIRAAKTAMRALQNKPLRRRKLDIHFSIPKIRETPHKRHHKFIEFYDVRDADAALRSLNRMDIAGKRIKLEPSRPGGARRNLIQQLTQEPVQDENWSYRHQVGSPITNSPPGIWAQFGSPSEDSPLQTFSRSPTGGANSYPHSNSLPGLASVLPPLISNSVKIAPIGKDQKRIDHTDQIFQQPRSFVENMSSSPRSVSSFGLSTPNASGIGTLSGPQFLWGSPPAYTENSQSSTWQTPSMGHSLKPSGHGLLYPNHPHPYLTSSQNPLHHHHVGSAPSGISFERNLGYFPESLDASFISPAAFGGIGTSRNERSLMMNYARHPIPGNISDNGSPNFKMFPSPRVGSGFFGSTLYPGVGPSAEAAFDRSRSRRVENSGSQLDSKKLYQLDLGKIVSGEDTRTTLMIKNIPNKYTSKMLLAAIDETHLGTYDFLYLPIDFKNKCNVGYAFINMVSSSHIVSFYQAFNGKKWEKFNSEKVASLAYARIQGKSALVTHFQNSSLMNEDKRCRPILFHSQGTETADQELLSSNGVDIRAHEQNGSFLGDSLESATTKGQSEKPETSSIPGSGTVES